MGWDRLVIAGNGLPTTSGSILAWRSSSLNTVDDRWWHVEVSEMDRRGASVTVRERGGREGVTRAGPGEDSGSDGWRRGRFVDKRSRCG